MHTVELVYNGHYDTVVVNRPDGTRETVARGGRFATTTEHAAALLEQRSTWKRATRKLTKED